MKNILLVDADPVVLRKLADLLRIRGGYFNIMTASDGREAMRIIGRVKTHLLITGLHPPTMDGFQLLAKLSREYPDIRIIVMIDADSPVIKAKIRKIGPAVYIEAPVDLTELTKKVFTELSVNYGGGIQGISLSSFLQMIELERKSCILTVQTNGRNGRLFMEGGDLVAAETGEINGNAAAIEILKWDRVFIDIDYSSTSRDRDIRRPLMSLLLESTKEKDENGLRKSNRRNDQRFKCLIGVDYDISDWSYKSIIRNISMGGVYIETDQPASVGQRIIITLSAGKPHRECSVTGKVARRDMRGIGVAFDPLSLHQQQVVSSILEGGE